MEHLSWNILRTMRLKFVQMMSLGIQMVTPLIEDIIIYLAKTFKKLLLP